MFYEKLTKLCMNNNISLTTLLTNELHMSSGNLTKWKNGIIPKSDTVQKIANYFNVSTDYLLGNEQKNKPTISEDDELRAENDKLFNGLPEAKKQQALEYLRFLAEHKEK